MEERHEEAECGCDQEEAEVVEENDGAFPWAVVEVEEETEEELRLRLIKAEEKLRRKVEAEKRRGPEPKERSAEEWAAIFEKAPTTEDGYMVSYLPHESDGYKEALKKYGFCVVKVLSDEDCDAAVEEFMRDANNAGFNHRRECTITLDDPTTWENINWPSKSKFLMNYLALGQQAFNNRTNENIYKVYSEILGTKKLWCSIDKWGIMRGTKNLSCKNDKGQIVKFDRPEWRFSLLPHWDCNPWVYVDMIERGEVDMYQSLVALVDCPEEVGGFYNTPGCMPFLKTWTSERKCPHRKWVSHRIPLDDPMVAHLQKVPLRKGEMVIFNTGQMHCNFPNYSDKCRLFQFIRMLPATRESEMKDKYAPRRAMADKLYKDIDLNTSVSLTPLGRRLVGLDEWPEDTDTAIVSQGEEKEKEV